MGRPVISFRRKCCALSARGLLADVARSSYIWHIFWRRLFRRKKLTQAELAEQERLKREAQQARHQAELDAGYSDFRSGKVGKPSTGDALWSIPTLVRLNPLGAPIAHASLHVSAVLHSYDTDTFLPPHK
jgi:hypothetical protein